MVKLSIVIPYYNTYELTIKLLEQLCKQLTDEVEVFLVDDGCFEKRLDVYNKKINVIHLEENVGGASAMNVALKKTNGKYIAIIDSDDMIVDDYIKTLLKEIKERHEDVIFFDWKDMHNGEVVHHPSNYAPWKAIYKKEIMPFFRNGWRFSYDVPFQADLSARGYSYSYIDKVLYIYNSRREGSLTLEKERIRRESMVKVEVIKGFTLSKYDEVENIERKNVGTYGKFYIGDKFECSLDMAEYLTGKNPKNEVVVRVIEVKPVKEATFTEKTKTKKTGKVDKKKEKK